MAIDTWFTPEQRRYIETRKAVRKTDKEERKHAQEAAERAELWAWYEGYDVSDSFAARDRAREVEAARMVREQIQTEVLITEVDKAVHERYNEGQNPSNNNVVGRG